MANSLDGRFYDLAGMDLSMDECQRIRREFELLFDQVPCNIIIIDKDYHIVRANERARRMIGPVEGKPCYQSLKGLARRCDE